MLNVENEIDTPVFFLDIVSIYLRNLSMNYYLVLHLLCFLLAHFIIYVYDDGNMYVCNRQVRGVVSVAVSAASNE